MKDECIQISQYTKTIDQWMVEMNIPSDLREKIATSDVILLPVDYHNKSMAFANGAYEFMEYCIGQNKLNFDICCTDDEFTQIEMCSFQLRLGRYFLSSGAIGVIFWNMISNYIYSQVEHYLPQTNKEEIVDTKESQSAPEVSFSIIFPDANGLNKEIKYDGPLEGIEKVGELIKSMTDETTQRDTTFINEGRL
jgi:hypothetical protein